MLVLDLSSSMLSVDDWNSNPRTASNRLQVLKPVLERFINDRPNDRIGVVVFAGEAFTLSPLTFDHDWLRKQLGRMKVGLVSHSETAIGDALALGLSRLEQEDRTEGGKRLGAFVILLTDGENNAGVIEPLDAAELAEKRGIPIFPIATGSEEFWAPNYQDGRVISYRRQRGRPDFSVLEKIAEQTGGVYLRARSQGAVGQAFNAINRTKQIEFDSIDYRLTEERFAWLAVPGGLCLVFALCIPAIGGRRRGGLQ
jgi:Ca-activated chloride channel family protein